MTERTLKEGLDIKKRLDVARELKRNIEDKRSLCTGNTSEVRARRFEVRIIEGTKIHAIDVSNKAAYEALNIDLKNVSELVDIFEKELAQLN